MTASVPASPRASAFGGAKGMGRSAVRAAGPLRWIAGLLVLGMLTAAGCAGDQPEVQPQGLPEGVTVSLLQLRSDVADRHAQVQMHNGTDAALTIGELSVADPRFAEPATRVIDQESELRPGATVDLRIQLPLFACPASGVPASVLTVRWAQGSEFSITTVPLPEQIPFLAAMYERECFGAGLAEVVAVSFGGFTPSPTGEPAELLLEFVPTGTGEAVIVGIHETNLLTFDGAVGSFVLDAHIAGRMDPFIVALPLMPWRCDPHAVQEDKRGTVFTLDAEVGGVAGQIELRASPELRGQLLGWVASWCEFGS